MRPRVIILGAGLGGLSAAWVLSRSGFDVTLLEKTAVNGGLAVTLRKDGYEYDLGPHNIHTQLPHVVTFLRRHFSSFYSHRPTTQIFKRGRFIKYPITGAKILTSLEVWKLPMAALSFLWSRISMYVRDPSPQKDGSFRDWIINRFGSVVYREYFHDYPMKVWRLTTDRIDKTVAEKRIPITGLVDMVKALFRSPSPIRHAEFVAENYYLGHGIGEMAEFFENGCRRQGVRIENDTRVMKIHTQEDRVTEVEFRGASGVPRKEPCDFLLSTIPLNELVGLFDSANDAALRASHELGYCSSLLLFLKVRRQKPMSASMLYFSEPEVLFSRVSDTFSAKMCPEGKTLLCLEFPCVPEDRVWRMSETELQEHAEKVLRERGVLRAGDVEGCFVERVAHSYPRFELGYRDRVAAVFGFLAEKKNVLSYGRQGGFAYINTDNVMNLGFAAASAVTMADASGFTCQEWFQAHS